MFTQKFFAKKQFAGKFWPPALAIQGGVAPGGTISNLDYTFPINLGLNKNLFALISSNFAINFTTSKNLNALVNSQFEIDFNSLLNTNALINSNFPITIGLGYDIDDDAVIIDVGSVGERYWCNIKKINIYVLAK